MKPEEIPVTFECTGNTLVGICHRAQNQRNVGVVIVVGGPQYRVGSHRIYVYLARMLATAGISVFRFDLAGMGDSAGFARPFCRINPEIQAAIQAFQQRENIEKIILLGLCDGASASLLFATATQIHGLIMLNPWVRSQQSESKARLKHYYLSRLRHASFWNKVVLGEFKFIKSFLNFLYHIGALVKRDSRANDDCGRYQEAMLSSLQQFEGKACFILSANDLVAQEFRDLIASHRGWGQAMQSPNVSVHQVPNADHTFASTHWKEILSGIVVNWCQKI